MGTAETKGAPETAEDVAAEAADSAWLTRSARLGLAARGIVYVLIGVLGLQVALGHGQPETDRKGAVSAIGAVPGGSVLIWVLAGGFGAYGLWQLAQAVGGYRAERSRRKRALRRFGALWTAGIYGAVCVSIVQYATRTGSGGSARQHAALTARALSWPAGRELVGLVGAAIIGISIGVAWDGVRTKFERHLDLHRLPRPLHLVAAAIGIVGHLARGAAFVLVGALVVVAAVTHNPAKAEGLDIAIKSLAADPYGHSLIVALTAGLGCFGLYSFIEAALRRL